MQGRNRPWRRGESWAPAHSCSGLLGQAHSHRNWENNRNNCFFSKHLCLYTNNWNTEKKKKKAKNLLCWSNLKSSHVVVQNDKQLRHQETENQVLNHVQKVQLSQILTELFSNELVSKRNLLGQSKSSAACRRPDWGLCQFGSTSSKTVIMLDTVFHGLIRVLHPSSATA